MIKSVGSIRYDIGCAHEWLTMACNTLDWTEGANLDHAKQRLQKAKKLIDEAIVDLDGLIQDQKDADATR